MSFTCTNNSDCYHVIGDSRCAINTSAVSQSLYKHCLAFLYLPPCVEPLRDKEGGNHGGLTGGRGDADTGGADITAE